MLKTTLKAAIVPLLLLITSATIQAENHPPEGNSDELYNPVYILKGI